MPKSKKYVEPKKNKPDVVVMDVSKRVVNKVSDLISEWELFVSVTGELPDEIRMNARQLIWYSNELVRLAGLLDANPSKHSRNPTFRSIPVKEIGR
jgi:hypothetical protein